MKKLNLLKSPVPMRIIRASFGRTSQDRHSCATTHSVWKRKVRQLEKAGPPDILPFTYTFVPLHKVFTPLLVAMQNILELFSLNSIKKKNYARFTEMFLHICYLLHFMFLPENDVAEEDF